MDRFIYAYFLCGIVLGTLVLVSSAKQGTVKWKYVLGTLLFPSVVYGRYKYQLNKHLEESNSKRYQMFQWMWRIHLVYLLLTIFFPFTSIGQLIYDDAMGMSNADSSWGGIMIQFAGGAIGLVVFFIELLIATVFYLILFIVLVLVPRIMRPSY